MEALGSLRYQLFFSQQKAAIFGSVALSYFLIQKYRRTPFNQVRSIRKKFLQAPHFPQLDSLLARPYEENSLKQISIFSVNSVIFNFELFFVTTSRTCSYHWTWYILYLTILIFMKDGSGKSSFLKRVLNERRMTIKLDLYQHPISSEEEFMYQFCESIGKNSAQLF